LVEQDKTVLVVSHDPDLGKWVTRTVTLVDGRLVHQPPEAQPEMEDAAGPQEKRHA